MPVEESKNSSFSIDKISIEEFRNIFLHNLKSSFYKSDAIKKSYIIEGTICTDVQSDSQGTSFKIQNEDGNILNIYIPKRSRVNKLNIVTGDKICLFGVFNIYDNKFSENLDFLEFKASRIIDTAVNPEKKENIREEVREKGYLEKQKRVVSFKDLGYYRVGIITYQSTEAANEISQCFSETDFFKPTIHYIDLYTADEIANTIKSLDKNSYYDAIIITGIEPERTSLLDELPVIEAIYECNTLVICAAGHTIANEVADVIEDGPLSAAKMLLYKYQQEEKYKNIDDLRNENQSINTLYKKMINEKKEMEYRLGTLMNEREKFSNKIANQTKIMAFLGLVSLLAVIFAIVK